MGVELASNDDYQRRINARCDASARRRERCKRCKKKIPDTRRVVSLFCSEECHRNYHWEQITKLRTEMRAEYRKLTAPSTCACGEPLNNKPSRPGRIAKQCKKCRDREAQRRYAARQKEKV